jgi:hypothetical protein
MIGMIQINDHIFQTKEGNVGICKMDTHADTCVAGANKVIPFSNESTFLLFLPQLRG